MPRFECLACKTRFYSAARVADLFSAEVCPECGCMLEQIADDNERLGPLIVRREVARAQARFDAERWADDGGSAAAELVR